MATSRRPDETGNAGPGNQPGLDARDEDLDRRRRQLEAQLAARRPGERAGAGSSSGNATGYGQALRLSSEFIAGVGVGAALGWFIDRMAGTSPWGLIVFLLLGFGAGVLNVMRSAGVIAEPGPKRTDRSGDKPGN